MQRRVGALCLIVVGLAGGWSGIAGAQELSLTVGRFLGDDVFNDVPVVGQPAPIGFSDAMLFGARFSISALLVELEGTLATAGSNVFVGTPEEFSARFGYAEAGAVVRIFPGPVAPFLAGGIGYHRIGFGIDGASSYSGLGYYVGGGLKIKLGKVGLRGDLRDHITPIRFDKLDPLVVSAIGLSKDVTVHNFELSAALVIGF